MLGCGSAKGSQIATFREDVDPVHPDFEQDGSHRRHRVVIAGQMGPAIGERSSSRENVQSLSIFVIAHAAHGPVKVQPLKYAYLYELCEETASIVSAGTYAALGVSEGFDQQQAMWIDLFAESSLGRHFGEI